MRRLRGLALLFLVALVGSARMPTARAQTPVARYAFGDTTLLRDTLDLTFERLFPLADSLRVTPDSLRAFAIRYDLRLDRLVTLADSLGMPVDSVGPVLLREQFNPLSRQQGEHSAHFAYNSTYSVTRQSTSWGNNVNCDVVRGPAVLHNVTSVRIDRVPEVGRVSFNRSKTANTEAGWKVLPDVALGMRVDLQRSESFRLGSQRATSQNSFQGSLRSKHDFSRNRSVSFNLFGGPFTEPRSSLSSASKQGLGLNTEGRVEYAPPGWYTLSMNGNGSYRRGHAKVPERVTFDTRDLQWATDGALSLFPESRAQVRLTSSLSHDQTQRPTTFTRIATDTTITDLLVQEPSGGASVELAFQLQGGSLGSLNVTGDLGRSTRLLANEQKQGIIFDRTTGHDRSLTLDGQMALGGWSTDAHFTIARPDNEGPQRSIVNAVRHQTGAIEAVPVTYRERGTTSIRSTNANLTRRFTPRITVRAKGDIGLTSYRYVITDDSYLASTDSTQVLTSDPRDEYRQTLRLETTYAPNPALSSTVALEAARILSIYLRSDRSSTNREDRLYRAEWLWTYRLLAGLTANQRNQINATYSRNIFAPLTNRLSLGYATVTTLNARVTPRLTLDLTHNANYGPNGSYTRAADGLESFIVSDATRDYTLTGRIAYTPIPAFTLTLQPNYQANYRDDRSDGGSVPTLRRRQLSLSGGANVNFKVGQAGRLNGNITRNMDTRRDIPYNGGVPQPQPRSQSDYWSGQLQFSWSLQ